MSTIYDEVLNARPVEALFIDVHGHFGPWPETTIPQALDCRRVIAEMDRYGCDQVWMSTSNPGYSDDLGVKNDYVFDFAQAYPDRIIPYCTLTAINPERNVPELRRCMARGRCIGVKMHVYRQPPYTMKTDWLQPVLEILAENRLVYLNHTLADVADLEWSMKKYPDLIFMSGHFDPGRNYLAAKHPNYRDCMCAAMGYKDLEKEVKRLGHADTMLVGSDFPLIQLGFGIGAVAYADLDEQHKRNILGLNALKLLKRTSWFKELKFRKPIA